MKKKKILLLGGGGVVGRMLYYGLLEKYDLLVADINIPSDNYKNNYIRTDVTNYQELLKSIPSDLDQIINLVGMNEQLPIVSPEEFSNMSKLYVNGVYNVYHAAATLGIKKVVFVSSNHVTDFYESNGYSLIDREISVLDYPKSISAYGVLKLAGEGLGYAYHINHNLSIICLRLGTVRENELKEITTCDRLKRTILCRLDLLNLFESAIETQIQYGIYYGVSNNLDKAWSIDNAIKEIGYKPTVSSTDILNQGV